MKKILIVLSIGTFALFQLVSCGKKSEEPLTGACSGTAGPLFLAVRSVIQSNCALSGCHTGVNAQNGINFSENCTIVQQKDRIKVRAVDQAGTANQMPQPPNPALSLADRQKITDWVNAGGKFTD
jgi:uncharacterized membrane protein